MLRESTAQNLEKYVSGTSISDKQANIMWLPGTKNSMTFIHLNIVKKFSAWFLNGTAVRKKKKKKLDGFLNREECFQSTVSGAQLHASGLMNSYRYDSDKNRVLQIKNLIFTP